MLKQSRGFWRNKKALLLWADPYCNGGGPTPMHFHPMESQVHPEKRTRTEEAEGAEKEKKWTCPPW